MMGKFSRWLGSARRFFGDAKTARRPYHRVRRMEALETRLSPAVFSGGSSVATADVNGDAVQDMIVGAGPGAAPMVRVFSGKTGELIRDFKAFDASFTGGVYVAAGDVNGDGVSDIVAGAGFGGSPQVRVFDGRTGGTLMDFLAYSRRFRGGVRVAAADITGDNKAEVLTAAGPGGSPHVMAYDPTTNKAVLSFHAIDPRFTGGLYIATGDVTNDGTADIITGAGDGGLPVVSVFNPRQPNADRTAPQNTRNFLAYHPSFNGGVRVATANITDGPALDIVTGAAAGGGPHVRVFDSASGAPVRSFFAYDSKFSGGVFVASNSEFTGGGFNEIVVGQGAGGSSNVVTFDGGPVSAPLSTIAPFEPGAKLPNAGVVGDVSAPVITITSPTGTPTQRTNLTVTGRVADDKSGIGAVEVSVDGGAFQGVTFDAGTGSFSFTTGFPLNGSVDGTRLLNFRARDRSGNTSGLSPVSFVLDSSVTTPTLGLTPETDTGTKGDLITANSVVVLTGKTDPGVSVELVGRGRTVIAGGDGTFTFESVDVTPGANPLRVRATDSLGNTAEFAITVTVNNAPTVSDQIADVTVAQGAPATVINLAQNFTDANIVNTLLRFSTSAGPIEVELFDQQAPLTVANFLNYVDGGDFERSIFHRSVANFVVQGGGFRFERGDVSSLPEIPTDPPVLNEPGISNLRGTVAMAKLGGDPNSATSQFFFNLGDNSGNLDNQNGGFTVFGRVVSGLDVVDALAAIPVQNRGGVFSEIPLQDYNGTNFPGDTKFSNFAGLNSVSVVRRSDRLSFTVVANDNPGLVTTSVQGNNLTLNYVAGQTGTATITVRATDLDGSFVEQTFKVTVN